MSLMISSFITFRLKRLSALSRLSPSFTCISANGTHLVFESFRVTASRWIFYRPFWSDACNFLENRCLKAAGDDKNTQLPMESWSASSPFRAPIKSSVLFGLFPAGGRGNRMLPTAANKTDSFDETFSNQPALLGQRKMRVSLRSRISQLFPRQMGAGEAESASWGRNANAKRAHLIEIRSL